MKQATRKPANSIIYTIATTILFLVVTDWSTAYADSKNPGSENNVEIAAVDHFSDRFAAHTKTLHDKLKITPLQENLWNNLTRVMLENAKAMEKLIQSRSEQEATMTALDDLKSFYEIAAINADGLKKFIPAFEALYISMSKDQQNNANILFQTQRKKPNINKASANSVSE